MHLGKHDGLVGSVLSTPVAYAPLEGAPPGVGKPTGMALLNPGKERERPQPRLGFQAGLDFRPDVSERVRPGSPMARRSALRGQAFPVAIPTSSLLIHASLPCSQSEANVIR